jgi:hypothetical protein
MKARRRPTEGGERSTPARCGEILSGTLESLGLGRVTRHLALLRTWDRAITPRIRERASIEAFREGRLYLCVEDPIWLHELHMLRHKLKALLNKELGESVVEEVILRIGQASRPSAIRTSQARSRRSSADLSSGSEAMIKELLIPCEELPYRDALERLMSRWAARLI